MKIAVLSLAAVAVPGLCALALYESDAPHVLSLGLKRHHHDDPVGRDRRRFKRQTVDVDLYGYSMGGDIYSTNLTVGDPAQTVEVSVDTGSSDLWVVHTYNPVCGVSGSQCDELGTYDPLTSRTAEPLSDRFEIEYGDRSWAEGYYAVDTLEISGAELPEMQFGVAISSSIDKGILGIGYSTNVASRYRYPNLPELLVGNNVTSSNAYSLWLNEIGSNEGNILFGGVNTAKYIGELQTLPVIPYDGNYVHLWITLTGLGVESASDDISVSYDDHPEFPVVVLLDSGATLTYLPADIVAQVYSDLDVHFFEGEQFAYVPCNYLDGRDDYNVTFTFSGLTIHVPLRELVLQDALWYQDDFLHVDGEESCLFGILPSADFFPILGDTFLRSAYVVFDLDNNEISMAQANYNPGDDHILEIGTGEDAVPEATPVQGSVTTATVVLEGSALSLPPNHTNEPIFPTRTTTVEASTTAGTDPSVPTESSSNDNDSNDDETSDASGSSDDPDETDIAASIRSNPLLLFAGITGALFLSL
ncbi:aspartic peptidase domain-containing protein [Aspergillus karnatakaensis]|uniref:pepsin-like aspartic protease n=1 Tax=Aspergillus karnatakaensis TaxID=1810916 RepID=UPI003CCE24A1